jgi:membrane-associated phospholipid phosphatase
LGRAPPRALQAARLVAFGLLAATYAFFVGTARGRATDAALLQHEIKPSGEWELPGALISALLHPASICVAVIALLLLARRRGRTRDGILAVFVVATAAVGARALKALLDAADPLGAEAARDLGPAFFPSGHAAVSMALCLGAILVARDHRRALVFGGVVWCSVHGFVIVAGRSHHVGDVLGGYLLALALALLIGLRASCRAQAWSSTDRIVLPAIATAPVAGARRKGVARRRAV